MAFLRSIFGPSRDEIWQQIARDIGGRFHDGGLLGRDKLRYSSGEWEIVLDTFTTTSSTGNSTSTQTYTRMRAPFVNKDGLYFNVYRTSFLSPLGRLLGLQDIEVGDPFFDEKFVIKGNNETQVRRLLNCPRLKGLLQIQPAVDFVVRDDEGFFGTHFPDGVDQLQFVCRGHAKDPQKIKALFDLFACTLERLVEIYSAYEHDPNVRL